MKYFLISAFILTLIANIPSILAQSCLTAGRNGGCSFPMDCDPNISIWSSVYSPTNICVGSGNGCCVPKTNPGGGENTAFCNGDVDQGVRTAIGCLMAGNPKEFVGQLLGWGVSVGGGIAFLLIVYAGFMIITAAGDPKRVQAGRELLTSTISGLILIVLSVTLLNLIGVKLGLEVLGFRL